MWGVFVAETRSLLAERGGCPQLVQLSGTFMILNKLFLTQRRIHFPWPSWSAPCGQGSPGTHSLGLGPRWAPVPLGMVTSSQPHVLHPAPSCF